MEGARGKVFGRGNALKKETNAEHRDNTGDLSRKKMSMECDSYFQRL